MGGALGLAILSGIAAEITKASGHLGAIGAIVKGDRTAFMVAALFGAIALLLAITVIRGHKKDEQIATESISLPYVLIEH